MMTHICGAIWCYKVTMSYESWCWIFSLEHYWWRWCVICHMCTHFNDIHWYFIIERLGYFQEVNKLCYCGSFDLKLGTRLATCNAPPSQTQTICSMFPSHLHITHKCDVNSLSKCQQICISLKPKSLIKSWVVFFSISAQRYIPMWW